MNTPSLFDAIEGNVVRDIHARMEASNAEWMASVRHGFGFDYAGRVVTTDDLWAFTRSKRPEAHANLLRQWRVSP